MEALMDGPSSPTKMPPGVLVHIVPLQAAGHLRETDVYRLLSRMTFQVRGLLGIARADPESALHTHTHSHSEAEIVVGFKPRLVGLHRGANCEVSSEKDLVAARVVKRKKDSSTLSLSPRRCI